MLSVVVFVEEKAPLAGRSGPAVAMSRSLASLIGAAVEGLIGDVTIAGPSGLGLSIIADHAGCAFVEAAGEAEWLGAALAVAKEQDLFLLRAGYVPGPGFIEELRDHLNLYAGQTGLFCQTPERWPERLFPALAPIAGAIAPGDVWRARPGRDFRRMARALKGRTMRTAMHRAG